MGTHGTKASSPELIVTWRGFTAQGSMGQEAKRDVGQRGHRGTSVKCRLIVDIRYKKTGRRVNDHPLNDCAGV